MPARLYALMMVVLCASAMVVEPDNHLAFYLRGTDEKDRLSEVSRLLDVSFSAIFFLRLSHLVSLWFDAPLTGL